MVGEGRTSIAVVRSGSDKVHAIGNTCTHGAILLSDGLVEGDTVECWVHGSRFSLTSGWPRNLPAFGPGAGLRH